MQAVRTLSKRFVAWAIAYVRRYHLDPFVRTEARTIALLALFSLFILCTVAVSSSYLYKNVITTMTDAIEESVTLDSTTAEIAASVAEKLENIQTGNMLVLSLIVIAVTIAAGYVVGRIVLSPTRSALDSQKQFIANVAHELRTPLSIIKTNSEVALLDPDMRDATRKVFSSTVEELDRVSDILNNLLTLSASVRPERVQFRDEDLGPIVENSMRKLEEFSEPKRLEVTARMSERRIVWGNAAALDQIVTNILKNAIMYSSRGGHITITVEPVHPNFIELTVRDSGIGIARKDLFRVFEPFYRAERSRTRAKGGIGLGLPIVSELVRLHHGKITVRSIEGQGTIVSVLLPGGKESPDTEAEPEKRRENMSEISVDFSRGNGHEWKRADERRG